MTRGVSVICGHFYANLDDDGTGLLYESGAHIAHSIWWDGCDLHAGITLSEMQQAALDDMSSRLRNRPDVPACYFPR